MKKVFTLILSVWMLISLASCSGNNNNIKSISVSLGSEPGTLDPAISLTIDVRAYLSHLFDGLTYIGEDGVAKPAVAERWTHNDDYTEWRFVLRNDALWSDGQSVSANDFKYAWLRILNPETASGWVSFFQYIKNALEYNEGACSESDVGISVDNENVLVVTLNTPCSFFDSMVSLQPYYPVREDVIKKYGASWTQKSESFITNGAYTLREWKNDEVIVLTKNSRYYDKNLVNIENIRFILSTDSSVVMSAFETNEIDFVGRTLTLSEMEQISNVNLAEYSITKFLALNLRRDYLQDINVRKAINIALNRDEISKQIGNSTLPLLTFIPEGFFNPAENTDYTSDSHGRKYFDSRPNLDEAIRLLAESGYSRENPLQLDYLTNTSSVNTTLAEIVKEQLELTGLIKVNINVFESAVFSSKRVERDFDIVAASWAAEYPDITSYLYGFKSNDFNNYASFDSLDFDNEFASIFTAQSVEEKYAAAHRAETLVMDSFAIAPLYYEKTPYISDGSIENYYFDVTGCLTFKYATVISN